MRHFGSCVSEQNVARATLHRASYVRPRMMSQWNALGFRVSPGARSHVRAANGVPVFTFAQVWDSMAYHDRPRCPMDELLGVDYYNA